MLIKEHEIDEPLILKFNGNFNVFNDDELFELCSKNEKIVIERTAEGELIFMSPVGSHSSSKEEIINGELYLWNKEKDLGIVFSPSAGFTLANKAMRSADASFIFYDRWLKLPG